MVRGFRRIIARLWLLFGGACTILGVAGLQDDIQTWYNWIDGMMNNAIALALAELAVEIANYLNIPEVRIALVAAGLSLMLWPARWFWRIRFRIRLIWRSAMTEKIWVSDDEALELVKQSDWAKLRVPHVTDVNLLPTLTFGRQTVYGLPKAEKEKLKYEVFLKQVLESFAENNPTAHRVAEGMTQFEASCLRKFLSVALKEELGKEFGSVPSYKLN